MGERLLHFQLRQDRSAAVRSSSRSRQQKQASCQAFSQLVLVLPVESNQGEGNQSIVGTRLVSISSSRALDICRVLDEKPAEPKSADGICGRKQVHSFARGMCECLSRDTVERLSSSALDYPKTEFSDAEVVF